MTQQEFEKLTGLQVSIEEYEVANAMYMSHDNMDKQTFCEKFMEMGLENYMRARAESTKKLRKEKEDATALVRSEEKIIEERNQKIAELEQELHDFIQMTAVYLHSYKTDLLLDVVREKMGTLEYYKELLAAGCTPTKADLEMFIKAMEGDKE